MKSIITEEKIKSAEKCLIDNGIEADEAEIVLQALGYILLDAELYDKVAEEKSRKTTGMYLVDWGNGFLGGFNKEYAQMFNTPPESVFAELKRLEVKNVKIITPQELDELRGYHKLALQEYCGV